MNMGSMSTNSSMDSMGGMGDMHSMDGMGGSCKISMLWNWYTIDACFLSSSWHIKSAGAFAASCVGVALLTIALEFLRRITREYDALIQKQWRAHALVISQARQQRRVAPSLPPLNSVLKDDATSTASTTQHQQSAGGAEDDIEFVSQSNTITLRCSFLQQAIRAVLHAATFGVAYIIMLLAMYFNGYIIISIFIGAGLGKFFCDWMVVTLPLSLASTTAAPCLPVQQRGEAAAAAQEQNRNAELHKGQTIDEPTVCCA